MTNTRISIFLRNTGDISVLINGNVYTNITKSSQERLSAYLFNKLVDDAYFGSKISCIVYKLKS